MKIQLKQNRVLTFVEVCVVVFISALLVSLLFPVFYSPKTPAHRIACTSRLKQVGIAYRIWANDHENRFPFASTNAAGSLPWANSPEVFRHYQVMSNELVTPKVLACSADRGRKATTSFDNFSNANLSYFVGLDAREDAPQSILSGDRNLTGGTLSNGFLRVLSTNSAAEWTKEIHPNGGNIGLADGSARQASSIEVREQLVLQSNSFIRLAVP